MRKNTVRLPRIKLSFNFIELCAISRPFDLLLLKYFSFLTCVFFFNISIFVNLLTIAFKTGNIIIQEYLSASSNCDMIFQSERDVLKCQNLSEGLFRYSRATPSKSFHECHFQVKARTKELKFNQKLL